jgi:hypothetical protein
MKARKRHQFVVSFLFRGGGDGPVALDDLQVVLHGGHEGHVLAQSGAQAAEHTGEDKLTGLLCALCFFFIIVLKF